MKPVKVWQIEYCDYVETAKEVDEWMNYYEEEYESERWEDLYNNFKMRNIKTAHVEGKTRQGAIGNLKNILYNVHLEIINAVPVM